MILGVDGEPVLAPVGWDPVGDRERRQHAIVLEAQIPVQASRVMLVDDEPRLFGLGRGRAARGLGRGLEVALGAVAVGTRLTARIRADNFSLYPEGMSPVCASLPGTSTRCGPAASGARVPSRVWARRRLPAGDQVRSRWPSPARASRRYGAVHISAASGPTLRSSPATGRALPARRWPCRRPRG